MSAPPANVCATRDRTDFTLGTLAGNRRIEGSGKHPPRLGLRPQRMSAELTRLAGATGRREAPSSTSPLTRLSVQVTSGHCAESACLLPVDHATLHDKADALEHADVVERITWNSNDVGPIPRLQRTNPILPAE